MKIDEVSKDTFLELLRYLYTDEFHGNALTVFELADRFGVERLKRICESEMFSLIDVDNAAAILYTANVHNSVELRNTAMKFVLDNFDVVSKTASFHNVARADVDLVLEILKLR